jgi:hypothetical protein
MILLLPPLHPRRPAKDQQTALQQPSPLLALLLQAELLFLMNLNKPALLERSWGLWDLVPQQQEQEPPRLRAGMMEPRLPYRTSPRLPQALTRTMHLRSQHRSLD